MPERRVKLGVVGCGVIGPTHMKAASASPRIDLVAVADRREELAKAKAAEFKVRKVYREGADLIRDPEVEAVVLAFPAGERAALALQAFTAGKHVLLEKPGALSAAEIEAMIRVQGKAVGACCSMRNKSYASYRAARDFYATGALGELREVYCRCLIGAGPAPTQSPPTWRASRKENGGGILVNWSPYDFDYLMSVTGWALKPRRVFAQSWPLAPHLSARVTPNSDAENHYVALFRCEGGTVLHAERGEFTSVQTENAWQVMGTKGTLRLQMVPGQDKRLHHDAADAGGGVSTHVLWEGSEGWEEGHAGPVLDFAEAILAGRPPATDLRKTLLIERMFDAIYESARSGAAVDVPPTDL